MIEQAGGRDDIKARRRLVAAAQHQTMMTALGAIPQVAQDSAEDLIATLRAIDNDEIA